jgi:hypothetical protein
MVSMRDRPTDGTESSVDGCSPMTTDDLRKVRDWAQAKLDAEQEPPWAVKQYKDLIATLDEILACRAATIVLGDSPQLANSQDSDHQLSGNIVQINSARRRRAVIVVRLPM